MRGVGIIGRARSGKDTIANRLVEEHGFERRALADPLKTMALDINPVVGSEPGHFGFLPVYLVDAVRRYGWERVKDRYPEARRFLQRLGTEGVRNHVSPEFWWQRLVERTQVDAPLVVPDVRFANEARALAERGFHIWFVERPGVGGNAHVSETLGPDLAREVLVNGGSIGQLHRQVDELINGENA